MDREQVNCIAKETLKYMVENKIPVSPENYEKWFHVFKEALYYEIPLTDTNLKELYRQKYLRYDPSKAKDSVPKKYVYRVLDELDTSLLELINKVERKEKRIKEEKNLVKLSKDKELMLKFVDDIAEEIVDIKDDLQKERMLVEEAKERVVNTRIKNLTTIPGLKDGLQFEKDLKTLLGINDSTFSVIYLDIDNLKLINEKYGMEAGNIIIKKIGEILQKNLSEETDIYYTGNGEYAIILKDVSKEESVELANKLSQIIQNKSFKYGSYIFKVTVTFAIVQKTEIEDIKSFLTKIQKLIEKGKSLGKNQVVSE